MQNLTKSFSNCYFNYLFRPPLIFSYGLHFFFKLNYCYVDLKTPSPRISARLFYFGRDSWCFIVWFPTKCNDLGRSLLFTIAGDVTNPSSGSGLTVAVTFSILPLRSS